MGSGRFPYKRTGDIEMDLPEGRTCGDCVHISRCSQIFGHQPDDEVCDWAPSRFHASAKACFRKRPMKGISLWQPWASAIALGGKKIETRSWYTPYRGPLAILATAKSPRDDVDFAFEHPLINRFFVEKASIPSDHPKPETFLPAAAVVCICNLIACVRVEEIRDRLTPLERSFGNYESGRFAWALDNIILLPAPIPAKGKQGLFDIELEVPSC